MPDLLLLHGHGDRPESFAALVRALAAFDVVVPSGPFAVAGGRSWWDDDDEGPSPATLADLVELAGGCAVVAGFSQGAAVALRLGVGRTVFTVAGFVVPGGPVLASGAGVVVVHGEADEVVDPLHGRMVARRVRALGHTVDEHWHPGAHEWPSSADRLLLGALQRTV